MVCGMVLEPGVLVVKVERSERYLDRNVYLSTLTVPRVLSTNIVYKQGGIFATVALVLLWPLGYLGLSHRPQSRNASKAYARDLIYRYGRVWL